MCLNCKKFWQKCVFKNFFDDVRIPFFELDNFCDGAF